MGKCGEYWWGGEGIMGGEMREDDKSGDEGDNGWGDEGGGQTGR